MGAELGKALDVLDAMMSDKHCLRVLALAGAATATGQRSVLALLIRRSRFDVVVSTGANITHDILMSLGWKHYILSRSEMMDDERLERRGLYRIFNVAVKKNAYLALERYVDRVFEKVRPGSYPSDFLTGRLSAPLSERNSLLVAAKENHVPVFSPSLADSILGLQIAYRTSRKIRHDPFQDLDSLVKLIWSRRRAGALIVGGGTPKHFTLMAASKAGRALSYAAQLVTEHEEFGGLSGARLEEAKSWGKVAPGALIANVTVDLSIGLPILAAALSERPRK